MLVVWTRQTYRVRNGYCLAATAVVGDTMHTRMPCRAALASLQSLAALLVKDADKSVSESQSNTLRFITY